MGFSVNVMLYVLFVLVVTFVFFHQHKKFRHFGYLGIFVTTLISNITIFAPANSIVTVFGGRVYNPIVVGFIAALGSVLGEIIPYKVAASGSSVVQNTKYYATIKKYMETNGFLTIVAVTSIPNPIVNPSSLIAGSIKYPFPKYLVASFLGNWLQFTICAFFGSLTKHVWRP